MASLKQPDIADQAKLVTGTPSPPPRPERRDWSIEVQQGDIKVGGVELLYDSVDCKVFAIKPRDESGFGVRQFYAHGACYAAVLGFGLRGEETTVALIGTDGGWHSFLHAAANGAIWTLVRWREPEQVWSAEPAGHAVERCTCASMTGPGRCPVCRANAEY